MEKQLTYIRIGDLHPHPKNPRKELGDLTELCESIKAKGILQNLTVVPREAGGYTVIIGHRRRAAAKEAGLTELPCVIAEMSEKEQVATMLLENIQRSDLTVYEQAQGFQMMLDLGDTVEGIADKTGFSPSTVRKRVKMAELDADVLKEVSVRPIALEDFVRLSKIEDLAVRNKVLADIGTVNFNQRLEARLKEQEIARRLPAVKTALKAMKAKKISRSDTWNSKYEGVGETVRIDKWDEGCVLCPASSFKKGETVFYYLDEDYGTVRFYRECPKAKPVKRPAAEIEKEKRIAEARAKAEALTADLYALRKAFVSSLTLHSKNTEAMLMGAAAACLLHVCTYVSTDSPGLYQALGVSDASYNERQGMALKAVREEGRTSVPKAIYAAYGDGERNGYVSGYRGEWPKYNGNPALDALYEWLTACGYEMSDEERALKDGSHEIFGEVRA